MSGGGGSGSDGGGDMQVSGAEAAYSSEKGISTHADTKVQHDSFTRERDTPSSDSSTAGGIHRGKPSKIVSSTSVDNTPVYQANYADQDLETQQKNQKEQLDKIEDKIDKIDERLYNLNK